MCADRRGPVAGVLLAAGMSTRLGRNKLLLDLDGQSMLRHVASRGVAAGLDPLLVVLGFEADRLKRELHDLPCQALVNPDFELGQNSSFMFGLNHVPASAIAAVVLLGDMPFVTASMIRALIARYRSSDAPLALSRYADVFAPPTLIDRTLFTEFEESAGEGMGRRTVRPYRDRAVIIDWPAAALADLDSERDYALVRTRLMIGS